MSNKILSTALMVAGTSIGTGILALPAVTANAGFGYTALLFLVCWFFMTYGALAIMEADLWLSGESDLISMTQQLLGPIGKWITWVIYLLLLYSLICTYLLGGSNWFLEIINQYTGLHFSTHLALLLFLGIFGSFVYLGTAAVDSLNRWLMLGLLITYLMIVVMAGQHVDLTLINFGNFSTIPPSTPLIITAFGFAVIVPVLTSYLQRDTHSLLKGLLLGSLLPLAVYLIWEFVILGNIPLTGENGFNQILAKSDHGTEVILALQRHLDNHWISSASNLFAIFAVLTSFLGVSISLFHFLADGLSCPRRGKGGLLLILLTYLPPLLIVYLYPAGFSKILSLAGLFVAILLGLIPIAMVWAGRYRQNRPGYRLPGGKPLLLLASLFFIYVVIQQFYNLAMGL